MYTYAEARRGYQVSSTIAVYLITLKQGLSLNLKLAVLARPAGQPASVSHLSPPTNAGHIIAHAAMPESHLGAGELNSDPCACTTHSFPLSHLPSSGFYGFNGILHTLSKAWAF